MHIDLEKQVYSGTCVRRICVPRSKAQNRLACAPLRHEHTAPCGCSYMVPNAFITWFKASGGWFCPRYWYLAARRLPQRQRSPSFHTVLPSRNEARSACPPTHTAPAQLLSGPLSTCRPRWCRRGRACWSPPSSCTSCSRQRSSTRPRHQWWGRHCWLAVPGRLGRSACNPCLPSIVATGRWLASWLARLHHQPASRLLLTQDLHLPLPLPALRRRLRSGCSAWARCALARRS